MKKVSTSVAKRSSDFSQPELTVGLDLGDRSSWYCGFGRKGRTARGTQGEHHGEGDGGGVPQNAAVKR